MATAPTLDIDLLLEPVSEAQPAGPELRTAQQAVRDARNNAIKAEKRVAEFASMSQADRDTFGELPKPPDWTAVRRLALDALQKSRDLWVAAWLIEALTRLHGFAGFRDGVRLTRRMSERFWLQVHPQPNKDEGLDQTFRQLAGLDGGGNSDGTLIAPLLYLPITAAEAFSVADYKDAVNLERSSPAIRQRRIDQGAVTVPMIEKAVAATPASFFQDLLSDLKEGNDELLAFDAFLGEKEIAYIAAGGRPFVPPSSKIRDVLDECLRLSRSLAKDVIRKHEEGGSRVLQENIDVPDRDAGAGSLQPDKPVNAGVQDNVPPRAGLGGTIESRGEAFAALLVVKDFFRRTEPHSPISYALEQVVRWGDMSLPELLSELVADKAAREEVFRRAGIIEKPKTG